MTTNILQLRRAEFVYLTAWLMFISMKRMMMTWSRNHVVRCLRNDDAPPKMASLNCRFDLTHAVAYVFPEEAFIAGVRQSSVDLVWWLNLCSPSTFKPKNCRQTVNNEAFGYFFDLPPPMHRVQVNERPLLKCLDHAQVADGKQQGDRGYSKHCCHDASLIQSS